MALIEINFLIFCFLGSLSQIGSRPLALGQQGSNVQREVMGSARAKKKKTVHQSTYIKRSIIFSLMLSIIW